MAFVTYFNEYLMERSTSLDNLYISEHMPSMPDIINKVYIYGLFLCSHSDSPDNSIDAMGARLGLDAASVTDAYRYLAECGLVQILHTSPIEVRYVPAKIAEQTKTYQPAKYADFNARMQEILAGRMLTPHEYNEYYFLTEQMHLDPEALLMIAQYAVSLKGNNVGHAYITTVARNWLREGVNSVAKVEERLLDCDRIAKELGEVLRAVGSRRAPDVDDRAMYLKWIKSMDFTHETVLAVAKTCKKGGTQKLDAKLAKYYEAKLFTPAEIAAYEANLDTLYALARKLNRTIGVYYENLDNVVDTYVAVWLGLGFDDDSLTLIAEMCFKRGIRTLDGLDGQINKFYRQGLVTKHAILAQMDRLTSADDSVREVLAAAGQESLVTSRYRDFYRTWTYGWGMPHDVVLYAAAQSKSAAQPMSYINKILSDWSARGIKTADAARAAGNVTAAAAKPSPQAIATHTYTPDQFNALIDDINQVEF